MPATLGGEPPRQPAGLVAQVAADRQVAMRDEAALSEQEIDDCENCVQPNAQNSSASGVSKLTSSSRSRSRARSTRFWTWASVVSNAAGDLRGAETAERLQHQGDAGFGRHRFVAADEEQAKRFVPDLVGEMRFDGRRRRFPLGVFDQAQSMPGRELARAAVHRSRGCRRFGKANRPGLPARRGETRIPMPAQAPLELRLR